LLRLGVSLGREYPDLGWRGRGSERLHSLRDALRAQEDHNITGGLWLETIRGRRLDAFLVHVDCRKQWREVEGSTREFRTSNASLDSRAECAAASC
jgi:hypothetical protein